MSDKPLFQNTDEQEEAYAGDDAGELPRNPGETGEGVVVPGAAFAGPLGAVPGQAPMGGTGAPVAGPEVAGAAHVPREDRDDDGVLEDSETQRR